MEPEQSQSPDSSPDIQVEPIESPPEAGKAWVAPSFERVSLRDAMGPISNVGVDVGCS